MPITTLASLRTHLQWALELEHSTIPPYLCALYSIPDGSNVAVSALIRSVVMEEMLHMVLAANLLNAVGGKPDVSHRKFVPSYPAYLPHSDKAFQVNLLPFSTQAVDTFLKIERPMKPRARPRGSKYHTIGQFYAAVLEGVELLERRARKRGKTIFTGKRRHQIAGEQWYYGGGGAPIMVVDLDSARKAIHEIMEQGEGLDHTIFDGDNQFGQVDELAHYFRFYEIRKGRRYLPTDAPHHLPHGAELPVDWSARYPMTPNPKVRDFRKQPGIHRLMVEFNQRYTALLQALHTAFNGKPAALRDAVPLMYELKYRAQALMTIPTGRADGSTAGPSFELVPVSAAARGSRPSAQRRRAATRRRN
ncbi:MAG: ferritin-like protein [Gemmatimonadota bacterium]|nr:ferritin-like protein [Gemmatimonadota bacterium]